MKFLKKASELLAQLDRFTFPFDIRTATKAAILEHEKLTCNGTLSKLMIDFVNTLKGVNTYQEFVGDLGD